MRSGIASASTVAEATGTCQVMLDNALVAQACTRELLEWRREMRGGMTFDFMATAREVSSSEVTKPKARQADVKPTMSQDDRRQTRCGITTSGSADSLLAKTVAANLRS
jgi:hypothetical protein